MSDFASQRVKLLADLDSCNHAQAAARRDCKWVEYQQACEAGVLVSCKLYLLQTQEEQESKGKIV